ncbi:spinster family MFS transporter [Sphingomonas hengshuiensis]|uniref:spinster family MFS transporter n=1 Tax=Sphingomonas hengshuiensis TaxID=1609977 RepID=UPI000696AA94|nr:MFS transporter [Sphingomonas hengshuiensis]
MQNEDERLLSAGYGRMFIAMSFLVAVFNFADRAVLAVLAQPIKRDLGLSDFQLGILQGVAFAFLYAILGLPIGRLAERISRVNIIAASVIFWSVMTAACGMIGNFTQLLLCRVGVGMGEAGAQPATSSLVSDHFPREKRASVMSLIFLGSPAGAFLGATVGGWVAAHWGWRMAFFALGIPGILVGLLVLLLLREPRRGLADNAPREPTPPPNFKAFLRVVGRKRGLFFVILGGSMAGFGMTAISQFLAIYLARMYDLPVQQAGSLYGTISAIALTTGLVCGSFGTDWLSRRGDRRWPAWGAAIGLAIAPFLYWIAFNTQSVLWGSVMLCISGAALLLFYGPTLGMIQNLLEPRMRATGAALFAILYTIFGSGLGPTAVGWLSDHFASGVFTGGDYLAQCHGGKAAIAAAKGALDPCAIAATHGIKTALMAAVCIFFAASLCYLIAARTLREDFYIVGEEKA